MAELVHILPTLSLIDEESIPSDPATPSVLEMLESFGLGIGESPALFDLEGSELTNEAESLSQDSNSGTTEIGWEEAVCESTDLPGQDTSTVRWDSPPQEEAMIPLPNMGNYIPLRNQVEWDSSSYMS